MALRCGEGCLTLVGMTEAPQVEWLIADPSNHLLASTNTVMTTAVVPASNGSRLLLLTFRTPCTTFTTMVDKQQAAAWHAQIGRELGKMTDLVMARGPLPDPAAAFRKRR